MRKLMIMLGASLFTIATVATPATAATTTISASLSDASVRVGTTVYVQGTVSPADALAKVIVQRAVDHKWVDRAAGAVNPTTGKFKVAIKPSQVGSYSLRVRSNGGSVASSRLTLKVSAPPSISAGLSSSSVRVGTTVYVQGTVTPPDMSSRVVVQRAVDKAWSDRAAGPVNRSTGAYKIAITPSQVGSYTLRVRSNGGGVASKRLTLTVTAPPPVVNPPTPPPSNCNPNYTPCVPKASDVDCAGGSGNGPAYVEGPVHVIGTDVYGLDPDHDGIGCE